MFFSLHSHSPVGGRATQIFLMAYLQLPSTVAHTAGTPFRLTAEPTWYASHHTARRATWPAPAVPACTVLHAGATKAMGRQYDRRAEGRRPSLLQLHEPQNHGPLRSIPAPSTPNPNVSQQAAARLLIIENIIPYTPGQHPSPTGGLARYRALSQREVERQGVHP